MILNSLYYLKVAKKTEIYTNEYLSKFIIIKSILPTPWSEVFLKKTVLLLENQKIPTIVWNQQVFFTAFTKTRQFCAS
jgi:hypothetical protein